MRKKKLFTEFKWDLKNDFVSVIYSVGDTIISSEVPDFAQFCDLFSSSVKKQSDTVKGLNCTDLPAYTLNTEQCSADRTSQNQDWRRNFFFPFFQIIGPCNRLN